MITAAIVAALENPPLSSATAAHEQTLSYERHGRAYIANRQAVRRRNKLNAKVLQEPIETCAVGLEIDESRPERNVREERGHV